MSTQVLDPLASAVADAQNAGTVIGKIECDGQFVILRKGEKKRVWLEGESLDGRQTEVTFRLNPLDCSGLTKMIERQILSNSREWSAIVWASLRDLGIKALPELRGKWAKVAMVKSGRKWTNNQGEEVEGTTLKFLAIYNSEAEAIAAWEAQFGGSQAHTPQANGAAPAVSQVNPDITQYLPFLPTFVQMAKGDLAKLATLLQANTPGIGIDNPHVQALLKAG